jgi:hypothetical protein
MSLSPGFLLAALVSLLLTQVARLAIRPHAPYIVTLGLSMLGLVGGEVLAGSGHLAHPSLGVLHPVADLLVVALVQGAGTVLLSPHHE